MSCFGLVTRDSVEILELRGGLYNATPRLSNNPREQPINLSPLQKLLRFINIPINIFFDPKASTNTAATVYTMFSPDKICASSAGPFRNIHNDNISSILILLFIISSALITAGIRFLVLGYCFSPLPSSKPDQPITTRCQHTDALPPSYSESTSKSASEALLAEAKSRKSQRPSITRFAICTTFVSSTLPRSCY
jgi:hypothetical protein